MLLNSAPALLSFFHPPVLMSFPPVGGSRSPNENASAVGGVGAFNQRQLVLICNVKAYISVQSLISMLSDVVVQPLHTHPPHPPFCLRKNKEEEF